MIHEPYIVLVILLITMVLFIWGIWRYDVVAMIALAIATIVGAVPFSKVFTGLINPAVITVAAVMIISQAIHRSGGISFLMNKINRISKNRYYYIAAITLIAAALSAFMNNVGALALMMPVAIQTAVKNKRSPSLILLPLALASALGGLITMIGTPPNLLIASYRAQFSGKPFAMFDFSYVGLIVAAVGILFLTLIGWRLIPAKKRKGSKSAEDLFEIEDYITEIEVPAESPIIGKTLRELETFFDVEYLLIAIIRNKRRRATLPPDLKVEPHDIFIIEANPQKLQTIVQKGKFKLSGSEDSGGGAEILQTHEISTMEAVISPGSRLEGRTLRLIRLKARFGINLIAIAREGKPFRERLTNLALRAGDVLLLQGPANSLAENISTLGILPLNQRNLDIGVKTKTWLPIIIFFVAIMLTAFRLLPVQVAFAGAILAMILFRSIPTRMIYDGIEWPVIILLAAMIPLGEALQSTGATALISTYILSLTPHLSSTFIITILFIITMTLSDFMNNAATTVVMAPIAASIAAAMHANIDPFLMAVAVAASCSFLTPIGHQNNTIVMGPGGYRFTDYIRIGLPLEILVLVVAVPTILWAWPI